MVDYGERNFNTDFSGLVTTVIIMGVVGGVCLGGFETLRQMKRLPDRHFVRWWRASPRDRHSRTGVGTDRKGIGDPSKTTQEDWEMGHLYHARTFHATTPSPPLSRWPIGWAWQSLQLNDWFYATHCGMDNVVYVRFLRACVWWLFLQCLTTAPILLAIHFTFSKGVPLEDMSRASLSYLVTVPDQACPDPHSSDCPRSPNVQGRKLLWIHLCLLWYISATWFYALWWIGKGSIKVRRRLVDKIATDRSAALEELAAKKQKEQEAAALQDERVGHPMRSAQGLPSAAADGDSSEGWRQRTILVTNLPATMRDEASLRRYFEEFLRPDDASVTDIDVNSDVDADANTDVHASTRAGGGSSEEDDTPLTSRETRVGYSRDATPHLAFDLPPTRGPGPDITPRRNQRSPIQTVIVVRKMNELSAMLTRRQDILQQLEEAHVKLARNVLEKVGRKQEKNRRHLNKNGDGPAPAPGSPLDILTQHLARFVDDPVKVAATRTPALELNGDYKISLEETDKLETVWEVLSVLPRQLLDPYQPVTSLSALFRGQKVPSIDYLLTKLNLLTALIAEMKARPPTDYEPTSSAFVTFRDPRQARMVWRELKTQIVMRVRMAPEVKDLDWDRIMRTSFTGDLVRGFGVNAFFWAFTVFWVIPVQIITTALFSVEHLKEVVPGLARFFNAHQRLEGFISVTLPTVLVSLITMSVPELVFQISKRAQGFVTWSSLYDQCLCRYWKFVVCNIVIFFCIGTTTLEAILQQIGNPGKTQILDNIAFAFPTAAPFFVSYLILGLALHTGFELLGFMVPILQHFLSANKATTPRARALRTLPRNFNRYYWLPFHILIMTIVFIFAILNPLIIPFALIYMFFALVVFKKNFAFTYYRRFNEKDGVVYFVRLFRFTLDGLTTGQVVILIFFSVTDQQKAYIALTAVLLPLTVGFKWLGTRLWKSQCRAIEDDEANAICGILTTNETMVATKHKDYGNELGHGETAEAQAPLDARASGRFPAVLPAPSNKSRLIRLWQALHDSFNANGADRPSYIARRSAQGKSVDRPVLTGARFALKTPHRVAEKARKDTRNFKEVAKISLGVDKVMKMEAEREAVKAMQDKGVDEETVMRRASKGARTRGDVQRRPTTRGGGGGGGGVGPHPPRVLSSASTRRRASQKGHMEADGMTRGNSVRSIYDLTAVDDKPFLSGFEAVANHAPVVANDDSMAVDEYADGEESFANLSYTYSLKRSRSARVASGTQRHAHYPSLAESATSDTQTLRPEHFNPAALDQAPAPYSTSIIREPPDGLSTLTVSDNAATTLGRKASTIGAQDGDGDDEDYNEEEEDDDDDEYDSSDDGPLVRPHAKIRWDDTPNNQARYNNPFYACELDPFLWLPRDPMRPLNLCDTIEWHGAALVSSDGGHGRVGEWEEDDDDDDEEEDDAEYDEFGNFIGDDTTSRRSRRLSRIEGHEEIMINSELARRLEEEEDVDRVVDPAASLPKNVMDEYREAINLDNDGDDGDDDESAVRRSHALERRGSNMSSTSMGSPAPSVRRELDREFGRQQQHGGGAAMATLPASDSHEANMTVQSTASGAPAPALAVPPPGILQQQRGDETAAGAGGLRRDLSVASALAAAGGDPRKTHFAPDPRRAGGEHGGGTDGANDGEEAGASPTRPRRYGSMARNQSYRRSHGHGHGQEASALSALSSGAGSIRSTSTYGRTVTMRQALQAEVLEEERRRTIRDRLATKSQRKESKSMKRAKSRRSAAGGSEAGRGRDEESRPGTSSSAGGGGGRRVGHDDDENDDADAAAAECHVRHQSEILARHQRALSRRRRASMRERGNQPLQVGVGGGVGVGSPISPRLAAPASPLLSPTLSARFSSMGYPFRRPSRRGEQTQEAAATTAATHPRHAPSQPSTLLLQTPQRPRAHREASVASTIILHGSPLPAAATPVATSGAFPPSESQQPLQPAESMEMREMRRGAGGDAVDGGSGGGGGDEASRK